MISNWLEFTKNNFGTAFWAEPLTMVLMTTALLLCVYAPYFAINYYVKSKWLADAQARVGPSRSGKNGFLQPLVNVLKLNQKHGYQPPDTTVGLLSIVSIIIIFSLAPSMPLSQNLLLIDSDYSLLYGVLVPILYGLILFWIAQSRKDYRDFTTHMRWLSLLFVSSFCMLAVALMAGINTGSLSWVAQVQSQEADFLGLGIFRNPPFGLVAPVIYTVVGVNLFFVREGYLFLENKIWSGVELMIFNLTRAFLETVFSITAVGLFFGGWNLPFGLESIIPAVGMVTSLQVIWVLLKSFLFYQTVQLLLQPVSKMDVEQLLALYWKYTVPASLCCLLGTGGYIWIKAHL